MSRDVDIGISFGIREGRLEILSVSFHPRERRNLRQGLAERKRVKSRHQLRSGAWWQIDPKRRTDLEYMLNADFAA
jgi:hypothetical protein